MTSPLALCALGAALCIMGAIVIQSTPRIDFTQWTVIGPHSLTKFGKAMITAGGVIFVFSILVFVMRIIS